jgi:hypothetical protein
MSGRSDKPHKPKTPGSGKEDDCRSLSLTFYLQSPDEIVVEQLQVGNYVYLSIEDDAKRLITVRAPNGLRAGSLVGANVLRLYNCMQKNNAYSGEVIEKNGGNCKIQVSYDA